MRKMSPTQITMADDDKEQKLKEKIASQKAAIADLPSLQSIFDETGPTSPETKARAQLIKELSDNEEQLELLIESKRVAAVVRLQDELHPPLNSEDCPICLETIKHVNSDTTARFWCCGGLMCKQCADERKANCKKEGFDEGYRNRCPLCREKMYGAGESKKVGAKILEHANRGRAWAQTLVGKWYFIENGKDFGFPLDKEKGLHFLKQAVDQRDSDALLEMAMLFFPLQRDESKHMYYLKEAADLGHPCAQEVLSDAYRRQKDDKGSFYYATLAASQGDIRGCGVLGTLFMSGGCGIAKSLILGKHYYGKTLEDTKKLADSQCKYFAYRFSIALYQLGCEQYEGILEIPGHSSIPKSIFWMRTALELEGDWSQVQVTNDAIRVISDSVKKSLSQIENQAKSHCANCWKPEEFSSLKRCVRCLGAWYCGKECQVQHWKAGHKIDCIKRK